MLNNRRKTAFTLAEVLITLGIIGVVAAITMPTLITNHKHHVIETKLKKFNSVINQAVKMSVAKNGTLPDFNIDSIQKPETGFGTSNDQDFLLNWYNTYILKNLNGASIEKVERNGEKGIRVLLPDGTGFTSTLYFNKNSANPVDMYLFYCLKSSKCELNTFDGKDSFLFSYSETKGQFFPSYENSPSDLDTLKNHNNLGCYNKSAYHQYCTRLIEVNGWKIPDDYPW